MLCYKAAFRVSIKQDSREGGRAASFPAPANRVHPNPTVGGEGSSISEVLSNNLYFSSLPLVTHRKLCKELVEGISLWLHCAGQLPISLSVTPAVYHWPQSRTKLCAKSSSINKHRKHVLLVTSIQRVEERQLPAHAWHGYSAARTSNGKKHCCQLSWCPPPQPRSPGTSVTCHHQLLPTRLEVSSGQTTTHTSGCHHLLHQDRADRRVALSCIPLASSRREMLLFGSFWLSKEPTEHQMCLNSSGVLWNNTLLQGENAGGQN